MKYDMITNKELSYVPCRYGTSRISFRGPRKSLELPYIAILGSTETYGKFVQTPYPDLLEQRLQRQCINFGSMNAGIDAFINDSSIMDICQNADATVVQVMGTNFLSNRFYSVHPRRNDRFLRASTVLQAIYPEVDFAEFTFTRHMLSTLRELSPDRFDIVISELRTAWVARMKSLIGQITSPVILLWFAKHPPTDLKWDDFETPFNIDPLFITKSMLEELEPYVLEAVQANPSDFALSQGVDGLVVPHGEGKVASEMMGAAAHDEVCAHLMPILKKLASNNVTPLRTN